MYLPGKKKARLNLRVLAGTIALSAGMVLVPFQASADSISDWKQQYASLQEQLQQVQGQLSSQNSKVKTEQAKLDAVNKEVTIVKNQISVLKTQIDSVNSQIKDKQTPIDATQTRVEQNTVLLKQRLRAMYMSGDDTFLTVLLDADNLSDFLTRVEMVRAVSNHDNEIINNLKTDASKLKEDKATLAASQESLLQVQGAAAAKQAILNAQVSQQQAIVKLAKSSSSDLQDQVDSITSQASQTDAQIESAISKQAAAAKAAAAKATAVSTSATSSSSLTLSASALGNASAVVSYAEQFIGASYVSNTAGPSSFDCSGFTMYVFANAAGISLPHSSAAQASYGSYVAPSDIQAGDLVFFGSSSGNITHVGIATSSTTMISAANPSDGVCYSSIYHFNPSFVTARRVL